MLKRSRRVYIILSTLTWLHVWHMSAISPQTRIARELHNVYERLQDCHIAQRCDTTDEQDEVAISAYPVAYERACRMRAIIENTSHPPDFCFYRYHQHINRCARHILYILALEKAALQRGTITHILQQQPTARNARTQHITPHEVDRLRHYCIPMLSPSRYTQWHQETKCVLSDAAHSHEDTLYHNLKKRSLTQIDALSAIYVYIQTLCTTLDKHD